MLAASINSPLSDRCSLSPFHFLENVDANRIGSDRILCSNTPDKIIRSFPCFPCDKRLLEELRYKVPFLLVSIQTIHPTGMISIISSKNIFYERCDLKDS